MEARQGRPGTEIAALYTAVWNGQCSPYGPELHEEGICITSMPLPHIGFEYRDPPSYVCTRFSSQLSWLIRKLAEHLQSDNGRASERETVFRLANRSRQYLLSGGLDDEDAKALLIEVLDEACSILGEVDKDALSSLHLRLGELAREWRP